MGSDLISLLMSLSFGGAEQRHRRSVADDSSEQDASSGGEICCLGFTERHALFTSS